MSAGVAYAYRYDFSDEVMVMFGIDPYAFETLWPSLLGVAAMSGVMVWGFIKIRHLMNEEHHDQK